MNELVTRRVLQNQTDGGVRPGIDVVMHTYASGVSHTVSRIVLACGCVRVDARLVMELGQTPPQDTGHRLKRCCADHLPTREEPAA